MRIIDSNKDFYDFYQNIYRDSSLTFDRRDSYNLSREEFASHFYYEKYNRYWYHRGTSKVQYILLQVCNTFWLFELTIVRADQYGQCKEYSLHLLEMWKNYNAQMELIRLSHIRFSYYITDKDNINRKIEAIKANDFETLHIFNKFTIIRSHGWDSDHDERHIPILQNIGIASEVNPLDIYLALEEYFATQITNNERTESTGLTDKEKIENHGFDTKVSFRGKQK